MSCHINVFLLCASCQVVPLSILENDDDFMDYVYGSNNRSVCVVCVRACV